MPKKLTEIEILKKYQRTHEFETDTAFADTLGISRQRLFNWFQELQKPTVELLQLWALLYTIIPPLWISKMACELLRARGMGAEIPCTCIRNRANEITESNPFCPMHLDEELITTQ